MALGKRILVLCVSKILTATLFYGNSNASGNGNFWQKTVTQAFSNSKEIQELKNGKLSSIVYKKQNEYLWFPKLQFELLQSTGNTCGDYIYIQGQFPERENIWLLNPLLNLSITQKLPGNGKVSLSGTYGFSHIPGKNAFIQQPKIQLAYNQSLGHGILGIKKSAEWLLEEEKLTYSELYFTKNMILQLERIFTIIRDIDVTYAEENYHTALLKQYISESVTARKKNSGGMQSELEVYYAEHQTAKTKNQLTEISWRKTELLKEIHLLVPDFNEKLIPQKRQELGEIAKTLYLTSVQPDSEVTLIEENTDSQIFRNIIRQNNLRHQIQEFQFSPVLFSIASFITDANANSIYSDWNKSFRKLTETPILLNFSGSIGIRIIFEMPGEKRLRKELFNLENNSVRKEFRTNILRQKAELEFLKKRTEMSYKYLCHLENEISTEKKFRQKRENLLEQNMITQDEFLQSESLYFLILRDYADVFWDTVMAQLRAAALSPKCAVLLTAFLGEGWRF